MTSLWPQIEPILAHVAKPARYDGCGDGAVVPRPLREVGRTGQWILRHGARQEPLRAVRDDATVAPHAVERAS